MFNQDQDQIEDPQGVDYNAIISALADESQAIAVRDIFKLSDMPQAAFDRFISSWAKISAERRKLIARNMADIAEQNYQVEFSPFTPIFLDDQSADVRLAALDMMWDTTNLQLVNPIIRCMETDKKAAVRASAAATLGHYLLMMQWGELPTRHENRISAALRAQLDNPVVDSAVYRAALESMASKPDAYIDQLIRKAYDSRDMTMRKSAIFAMGRTADSKWMFDVQAEFDSDEPEVRAEAARAIGTLGGSDSIPGLIELAEYDDDLEVKLAAVYSLGQIGGDLASQKLTELSEDPDAEELYDAIDEALEEMTMLGMDLDLSLLDWSDLDIEDDDA